MNNFFERVKPFAPTVLRVAISLVFLWFGSNQLFNTSAWTGLIPDWTLSLTGFSPATLVHLNGAFELVFGFALFLGLFTRLVAFFLVLHLLQIVSIVGYNPVGVRDFGLSMAVLSIFLHGPDPISLDVFLKSFPIDL